MAGGAFVSISYSAHVGCFLSRNRNVSRWYSGDGLAADRAADDRWDQLSTFIRFSMPAAAIIIGVQSVQFWIFAKIYGMREGLVPPDPWFSSLIAIGGAP